MWVIPESPHALISPPLEKYVLASKVTFFQLAYRQARKPTLLPSGETRKALPEAAGYSFHPYLERS